MSSAMAPEKTAETILETPTYRLMVVDILNKTSEPRYLELHHLNSNLVRFENPAENYLEYYDHNDYKAKQYNITTKKYNILGDDFDNLIELEFPWEYWPDLSLFDESDFIGVRYDKEWFRLRPANAKIRLFKQPGYGHIEHQPEDDSGLVRFPPSDELAKSMFSGDYPIKYQPYIPPEIDDWYNRR